MKLFSFFGRIFSCRSKKVLIFAHYHQAGILREDSQKLLQDLKPIFDKIIFVSAHIKLSELSKIPSGIECLTRTNEGYDFYSYKLGIEKIRNSKINYSQLTLMNSSFLCIDSQKLINFYFNRLTKKSGICGLTKSYEGCEHIQSYLMTFQKNILENPTFQNWWKEMAPLNIRQEVIDKYEMGLSKLISVNGENLRGIYTAPFNHSRIQNPTHAHYLDLMNKTGVLKIEVFKINPNNLNLKPLNLLIREDAKILRYIKEGLEN